MNLSIRTSRSILRLLTLVLFGFIVSIFAATVAEAQSKDSKTDYQTEGTTSILK